MPQACSICTAALENPHCGNCGEPFMYSTTGCVVTCSRIVSWMLMGSFHNARCAYCNASAARGAREAALDAGDVLPVRRTFAKPRVPAFHVRQVPPLDRKLEPAVRRIAKRDVADRQLGAGDVGLLR